MPRYGRLQLLLVPPGEETRLGHQTDLERKSRLDDDGYGYVGLATVLRNMGAISDDEWEEISRDWLPVSVDESSEPQEAAAAGEAPPSRF